MMRRCFVWYCSKALNFGYFYLVALNLTCFRDRRFVAMLGSATAAGTALPPAAGTSNLTVALWLPGITGGLVRRGMRQSSLFPRQFG